MKTITLKLAAFPFLGFWQRIGKRACKQQTADGKAELLYLRHLTFFMNYNLALYHYTDIKREHPVLCTNFLVKSLKFWINYIVSRL